MPYWEFFPSFPESDILWNALHKDSLVTYVKSTILWILLLLLSVVLLTPILLINMSSDIIENVEIGKNWMANPKFNSYLTTAMTMTMNVILIPFFIDIMVMIEDHITKSSRQIAILNRNFFFMLLNALLLPLTGLTTIKAFIETIVEKQPINTWPYYFSKNLLTTYNYFITYFIQLTFLSVGFWLLDLPHWCVKTCAHYYHNFVNRNKKDPKPFVDTYAFDLGYHSAYSLSAFAIMLLFATIVPYMGMIAGIFFVFKYSVDKYNLSFVYTSEFRGLGIIYKKVVPLIIFTIFMFQIINIGLFTMKTPSEYKNWYFWGGITFVTVELLVVLIYRTVTAHWKYLEHVQKRQRRQVSRGSVKSSSEL